MTDPAPRPATLDLAPEDRLALVALAVLQSLALLALHKALVHATWPATSPQPLFALYAVAVMVPLFLALGAARWRDRANAGAALALGLACFAIGWHAGWLAAPEHAANGRLDEDFVVPVAFSLGLATFLLAFHFRAWREGRRADYALLLDLVWRNALTLGFVALFLLAFWLVLMLWAALFKLIGIAFFQELFLRSEFLYPVLGLVGGWGFGLIRARVGMIATVRHLCEALARALLPIVSFIVVIFLLALPFTGLDPLWRTGHASALLLSLALVQTLLFIVVLAEAEAFEVHPWLRPLVLVAQALVAVNALLAALALALRVGQYGWSVERCWAALVVAFVLALTLAYAAVIARHREARVAPLREANRMLTLALAAVLLLVNSPLIEFRRIAAADQAARFADGRTAPAHFDGRYLRFELGPYGTAALARLAGDPAIAADPARAALVADAQALTERWDRRGPRTVDAATLRVQVGRLPGTAPDDAFYAALAAGWNDGPNGCVETPVQCVLGALTRGEREYLVQFHGWQHGAGVLWRRDHDGWRKVGQASRRGCDEGAAEALDLAAPLANAPSEFFQFRNGACLYEAGSDPDRPQPRPGASP